MHGWSVLAQRQARRTLQGATAMQEPFTASYALSYCYNDVSSDLKYNIAPARNVASNDSEAIGLTEKYFRQAVMRDLLTACITCQPTSHLEPPCHWYHLPHKAPIIVMAGVPP